MVTYTITGEVHIEPMTSAAGIYCPCSLSMKLFYFEILFMEFQKFYFHYTGVMFSKPFIFLP